MFVAEIDAHGTYSVIAIFKQHGSARCTDNVVTAREAREPDAYHDSSNRLLECVGYSLP